MLFPWRIELLGDLRAVQADRIVTRFRTRKTGLLLACLALGGDGDGRHPRGRSRDELADLLWPEDPASVARASLRNALSLLRRVLEPDSVPHRSVLVADRAAVRLNPDVVTTDVAEFEATLLLAARAGHRDERARRLAQALDLYRGELLPGYYDAWVLWERERLAERYFQALGQLLAHLEAAGDLTRALDYARRGASLDPLHEETHCALMRLYAALGQPAAARRQYQELEGLLAHHLGARPLPETELLVASLLDGREPAAASAPAAPLAPASPHGTRHPAPGTPGASPATDLPLMASLPQPSTRFFGRRHEIARLRALLLQPETRLVTLTGPGGCGKTRLAIEVALGLRAPWEEAVAFVSLQDVGEAPGILDKLGESLRLPRSPQVAPLDQVASTLSHQPTLLVLDNLEHLLPEGAAVIQELLERVAEVTLLVTSRQRLGVAGEQLFPVPSLTSEPSVALFVDRTQAVRLDFQLTEESRETVTKLCGRLEGLPLSLELAAARTDVLTPGQILEYLGGAPLVGGAGPREGRPRGSPLQLLRGGEGPGPERHRSLRAALEWSYRLLSPELARFFARLSVFRGGWTLAAAEAVCGGSETEPAIDAQEGLSQLTARSLVVAEAGEERLDPAEVYRGVSDGGRAPGGGEMRYRLLETLREFAAAQLSPQEEAALARQHAHYFLAFAEAAEPRLYTAAQAEWLERLEREHDNFRSVLAWFATQGASGDTQAAELGLRLGGTLGTFWEARGYGVEGLEQLTHILSLPGIGRRTAARAKALTCAGQLHYVQGDPTTARSLAGESLAIWRELGDAAGIARSCFVLGRSLRSEDDYHAALSLLQEGLAIERDLGNPWQVARTLHEMGHVARDLRDDAAARAYFAESLALWRAVGDDVGTIVGLYGVATQSYLDGDFPTARCQYEEGVAIARRCRYGSILPVLLQMSGEVARCEADYGRAATLYLEALSLWPKAGDPRSSGRAGALLNLGYVELRQGHVTEALRLFQEGLAIYRELESVRDQVIALIGLAGVARALGQPERAARLLGAVEAAFEARAIRLWSADRNEYEREVAGVRAALPEDLLAAAWAEGRAMALDTAITDALSAAPRAARGET